MRSFAGCLALVVLGTIPVAHAQDTNFANRFPVGGYLPGTPGNLTMFQRYVQPTSPQVPQTTARVSSQCSR